VSLDEIGGLPPGERADLFREAASRLGIGSPVILEKDYWVCWSLGKLFEPELLVGLVFKGGTSLSKAYGLIRRFSEDVDLTIPLSALDIVPPEKGISRKALARALDNATEVCAAVLEGRIRESLLARSRDAGISGEIEITTDPDDPLTLILQYPPSLSPLEYGASHYIPPSIRLEFGVRGGVDPASAMEIEAYCTQAVATTVGTPKVSVRVLAAERTFWEKATICHAAYHAAPERPVDRQSRHYSDLAAMEGGEVARAALASPELLTKVVENTRINFSAAWARYEEATPSGIHLTPHAKLAARLREDYERMSVMFFEPPPSFDIVMTRLADLEKRIRGI